MSNIKWRSPDEPVTKEAVEAAAQQLGVEFPVDYIECVLENNGARVSPELFEVAGKEKVFGNLITYDQDDDEFIVNVFHDYVDTLPEKVIPFAFDPGGNLICFDYQKNNENPSVVFWNHEGAAEKAVLINNEGMSEEQAEETARRNIFYIAESFTAFLGKLRESQD
ncbi:1,3-beta-glucan synthase regulator [Paenibacillus sp. BIHB 4019]|uniref:1,3-beta-glucan synthase regulator n=1 Tax=Paenibacillus sp. BIHB 4019 TaxID=1870819 RepID=A0A1B2DDB4_9BACL|nr:SMI1/KNR4 family protein [Paenibacillus sp. BIHB 4019]ANY65695.1 1,3-beta-glucan synthase regulator [Paenibacillus sp. BIHB 4019]